MKKSTWLILPMILFLCTPAVAEFYRYRDKNGNIRYTDDLSKVPEDQQTQVKSYEESKSAPIRRPASESNLPKLSRKEKLQRINVKEHDKQIAKQKEALDREYEALMKEKAELAKEKKQAKNLNQIKKYNNKLAKHNEKMRQWDKKRMAYNAEADAYNARITRGMKNSIREKP